jgi:sec-independent protein translocase protein TatA
MSRIGKEGLMFGLEQPSHWLFIILVLVVLFGAKRLPDSAKSIAKSLKIFKNELKDTGDEKKPDSDQTK